MGDRQEDPAGFPRGSADPAGIVISGTAPFGAAGLDQSRVAPDRNRANGKVLFADTFGTETTGEGIGELGSIVGCDQHRSAGGLAMRLLERVRLRLRSLFRRPNVEFELDAELRFHVDQL